MSGDFTPRQQILLWDLISRGGSALQKDLKPEVKPADREPLVRAKMISVAKQDRALRLTIEDGGWNCVSGAAPTILKTGEGSKYDRPILQFVLARLQAFAASHALSYAAIFAGAAPQALVGDHEEPADRALIPIEKAIRAAFFDIAGRPARDGVRLRALRDSLPNIDRAALDTALLKMRETGAANLTNLDNPRDIAAEGDAPLRVGKQTFHVIWIDP